MQTQTRTYVIVIKDYELMITMDDNVNWMKPTHLMS